MASDLIERTGHAGRGHAEWLNPGGGSLRWGRHRWGAPENKWASYAQATHLLIFNSELLEMDKELGNYVIVHELLHFRTPNHGKLWKSLMHAHLGDYERLDKRLRENDPARFLPVK